MMKEKKTIKKKSIKFLLPNNNYMINDEKRKKR